MGQERANLAVIHNSAADRDPLPAREQQLELLSLLQTTLELSQLLPLFSQQIRGWIPHDGFRYRNPDLNIEVQGGERARHSCSYRLTLEEQDLGELILMRRRRFGEQELQSFEVLLCYLLYPLRNALLYYRALRSAYTDPLTGLYNRTALTDAFQREWKLSQRQQTPLSLLMLDIDHFKAINDTHGHAAGDAALVKIAKCLRQTVRGSDMLFRYGGEEFVVLLSNTASDGAELLAQRLLYRIATMDCSDIAPRLRITASIGVATLNHPEETPEQVLKRADEALYRAKRQGRNRVEVA